MDDSNNVNYQTDNSSSIQGVLSSHSVIDSKNYHSAANLNKTANLPY